MKFLEIFTAIIQEEVIIAAYGSEIIFNLLTYDNDNIGIPMLVVVTKHN